MSGLLNSFPDLQEVINHPSEQTFTKAKATVEKQVGPPVGEGALLALGFVASQAAEKGIIHGIKTGKARLGGKGSESGKSGSDESRTTDSVKQVGTVEPLFEVEDFGKLRRMKIDGQEQILMSSGGFFKGKTSELREAVSPTKVHVLTNSAKDLHKLQAALIPELNKDPLLTKYVEEWKTMDPLFGLEKPGRAHAVAPDGVEQGAKAFTIYTRTAEDALLVNKRLEEICKAKGLGLEKPISTGNCDTVGGATHRIGIVRDTFPMVRDANGNYGSGLDDVINQQINQKYKVTPGQQLNDVQLRDLERVTGIEKDLLTYSNDGRLMLKTTGGNGKPYHNGFYADESDAVKTFGHLTERPAIYSLYKAFKLDPAEIAAKLGR
ncbi:MAG: hypothetical protein SGJ27_21435 [Candidatus Melainabacteria bacterium]|nr:hypothetical protein [Candidatus Melainabacteria bacterium]